MRRSALLFGVALAASALGCHYTSQYRPPYDRRPRVVWREDDLAVDFAGATLSPACAHEIAFAMDVGGFDSPDFTVGHGADPALRQALLDRAYEVRRPQGSASGGVFIGVSGNVGGGHSHHGGGSDGLEALAVIVILFLAPIDVYLSLSPPESDAAAALAIDLVNGYHEAQRLGLAACVEDLEPGGAR